MNTADKKTYRHIFFDLDRTLWDFDTNSEETFREIFYKYNLSDRGIDSFEEFLTVYNKHNLVLWDFYRKGTIEKEALNIRRFSLTLCDYGISDDLLSSNMAADYVTMSPTKTNLFPHVIDILEYLSPKYKLHIITNGFEEVQYKKIRYSGLMKYFNEVITSEDAGAMKPDLHIFNYAFQRTGALPEESLMIGDDEAVDIAGAHGAGIDQILVDYGGIAVDSRATYYIQSLEELYHIL